MEVERLPSPHLIVYPNRDKSQLEGTDLRSCQFYLFIHGNVKEIIIDSYIRGAYCVSRLVLCRHK